VDLTLTETPGGKHRPAASKAGNGAAVMGHY